MSNTPTPHIGCKPGDFARTVLMPGDPLRAKYIAEHFLEDARLVNNVRGVQGYTGTYQGRPISVMASGMGIPSIGIYTYELFHYYDVDNIIRVGSAGAMNANLPVRSVVCALSAYTNSNYGKQFGFDGMMAPCASWELLRGAWDTAQQMGLDMRVGPVYSSDVFYDAARNSAKLASLGVLCVEMETFALYLNAAEAGKNALSILTISDNIVTGEALDAEQRQNSFTQMMELALRCGTGVL